MTSYGNLPTGDFQLGPAIDESGRAGRSLIATPTVTNAAA